jgi:hypothetical protein
MLELQGNGFQKCRLLPEKYIVYLFVVTCGPKVFAYILIYPGVA